VGKAISRVIVLLLCASAPAQARDLEAARRHFRKASQSFAGGDFQAAATEYTLAYQASDDPLLLYNIAVALRLSGQRPQALRAYRMYLKLVPNPDNRAECEAAIRELLRPSPSPSPAP